MSSSSNRRNKKLLTDNAAAVKKVSRSLSGVNDKETEDCNDTILNDLLEVDVHNIDEQPFILRKGVQDIREDIASEVENKLVDSQQQFVLKCGVRNCHRDITYTTLEELVEHYNDIQID